MLNSIEALSKLISKSKNLVFLGGAGVSTESGIPDFRGEQGINRILTTYGESAETVLSRSFFNTRHQKFYEFYRREMLHVNAQPNEAHLALAKLESMGKLRAVITQNIDGLHQRAGSKKVLELHGSVHRNYCISCGRFYSLEAVMALTSIPKCQGCGSLIKPDVVLYEEGLDEAILSQSIQAVKDADLLIVGGTSLSVYPAAGLIQYYEGEHLVLINRGGTSYDAQATLLIREDIGKVLSRVIDLNESDIT